MVIMLVSFVCSIDNPRIYYEICLNSSCQGAAQHSKKFKPPGLIFYRQFLVLLCKYKNNVGYFPNSGFVCKPTKRTGKQQSSIRIQFPRSYYKSAWIPKHL